MHMIRQVHLDSNLTKQLKRLHKAGGNAKQAAEHAEAIIRRWASGTVKSPKEFTRITRFGEGRIKHCLKYDLVDAYRLIAVKDQDQLYFLYVGSHNECDQWIVHNTGMNQGNEKKKNEILPVQYQTFQMPEEGLEPTEDEAADDYLLKEISERELRIIFSGLCQPRTERQLEQPRVSARDSSTHSEQANQT